MEMGKQSACFAASSGIKRGPWTPEEDRKLLAFIQLHGHGSWRSLPQKAGLKRCGKSCRLRWRNYLRPDIKRGNFSLHEDQTIIQLHALLGNRWSAIAAHLPKRTDNEIKNYWNTHLKKRLAKIGFDPVTHKPKTAILGSANGDTKNLSNLSHIAQWESARLQAEARFVKESNLRRHESHQTTTTLNPAASILLDETASLPAHHHLDLLRASAWESLISMSKSSTSAAAPIAHDIINGQDHVYHGVNNNNNFEATTFDHHHDQLASMMTMEYDVDGDARGMPSTDLNELIGQYCGNECSDFFDQKMEGFEVGDSYWTSLEELM